MCLGCGAVAGWKKMASGGGEIHATRMRSMQQSDAERLACVGVPSSLKKRRSLGVCQETSSVHLRPPHRCTTPPRPSPAQQQVRPHPYHCPLPVPFSSLHRPIPIPTTAPFLANPWVLAITASAEEWSGLCRPTCEHLSFISAATPHAHLIRHPALEPLAHPSHTYLDPPLGTLLTWSPNRGSSF